MGMRKNREAQKRGMLHREGPGKGGTKERRDTSVKAQESSGEHEAEKGGTWTWG